MSRRKVEQEMMEARYPLFTYEVRHTIQKISVRKIGEEKRDLVDALWINHADDFGPALRKIADNAEATNPDGTLTQAGRTAILQYIDAAESYADVLLNLTDRDLKQQFNEFELKREQQRTERHRKKAEENDRFAFFQSPGAMSDLEAWWIKPVWSPEEAVALSFGKNPTRVNLATLAEFNPLMGSTFKSDFSDRFDELRRGIEGKQLDQPITPENLAEWAVARWPNLPDALERMARSSVAKKDKVSGKKLHTLYRMIVGLAIRHYDLDATDNGSSPQTFVFNAIAKDFKTVHVDITARTIGDTLREALEWAHIEPDDLVKHARKMRPENRSMPPALTSEISEKS